MEDILQYTPEELEQQRMRAQNIRGTMAANQFGASSQIRGIADNSQAIQKQLMAQQMQDQKMDQSELQNRRQVRGQGLDRALRARTQDYNESADRRDFEYKGERDKIGDRQENRKLAREETTMETQTYENADGDTMEVTFRWSEEYQQMVPSDPYTGKAVNLDGWKKASKYGLGGSGGYKSNISKDGGRWVDEFGNELYLEKRGGKVYDFGTGEEMPKGWNTDARWTRQPELTEGQETKYLADLEKRAAPILKLMRGVNETNDAFAEAGIPEGENPLSFLQKQRGFIGSAARGMADALTEGEMGVSEGYARGQEVSNQLLRLSAGLSQTTTELANFLRASGQDAFSEPGVMADWWRQLEKSLEKDMRMIEATTNPRILKLYERNLQNMEESGSVLKRATSGRGQGANSNKPKTSARTEIDAEIDDLAAREAALREELGL